MLKKIKIFTFLQALFIIFALSACSKNSGNGNDSTDGGGNTDEEPAQYEDVQVNRPTWDKNKRGHITYQMLMYSFADSDGDGTGDIDGLIDKLDYIDELGASAIWISPIHPASSYHGYDVLDYSSVNPEYGTMDDFKRLVDAAHAKGIKIYLDYVLNHTSSQHQWFKNASSSVDNPYRDYYIFSDNPAADIANGKIPMIATEGAAGYDSGQWFTTSSSSEGEQTYEFLLDWSNASAPTVTVTETDIVDEDNPDSSTEGAKYLYFGDDIYKKFYKISDNTYRLRLKFNSSWGFLIRTSTTDWNNNNKYGALNNDTAIELGEPFTIYTNIDSNNIYNILTPGIDTYQYHSHFCTSSFADLNYGAVDTCENSLPFKELVEAAKVWYQAGIDGFRLDAVKHIYHNETSDENPRFLKKFYNAINTIYKENGHSDDVYMVGEVLSDADKVAPYYQGLPAFFEFSYWYRLQYALNNSLGCYFAKDILSYEDLYAAQRTDYIEATKLSNHDENRTGSTLGGSIAKEKQAAAILLTSPGQPYIYYGEELGYTGTKDNGDEYIRQPMYWGDSYVTSYTDKIDSSVESTVGSVTSQEADENSILNVYKDFSELRNEYPALAEGVMTKHSLYNENASSTFPSVAAWYMTKDDQTMLVIHNLSNSTVTLPLASKDDVQDAVGLLGTAKIKKEDSETTIQLGANSSVVFEL